MSQTGLQTNTLHAGHLFTLSSSDKTLATYVAENPSTPTLEQTAIYSLGVYTGFPGTGYGSEGDVLPSYAILINPDGKDHPPYKNSRYYGLESNLPTAFSDFMASFDAQWPEGDYPDFTPDVTSGTSPLYRFRESTTVTASNTEYHSGGPWKYGNSDHADDPSDSIWRFNGRLGVCPPDCWYTYYQADVKYGFYMWQTPVGGTEPEWILMSYKELYRYNWDVSRSYIYFTNTQEYFFANASASTFYYPILAGFEFDKDNNEEEITIERDPDTETATSTNALNKVNWTTSGPNVLNAQLDQSDKDILFNDILSKVPEEWNLTLDSEQVASGTYSFNRSPFYIKYNNSVVGKFGFTVNEQYSESASIVVSRVTGGQDLTTHPGSTYLQDEIVSYDKYITIACYPSKFAYIDYHLNKDKRVYYTSSGVGGGSFTNGVLKLTTNINTPLGTNTQSQDLTGIDTTMEGEFYGVNLWNWGLVSYGISGKEDWIGFIEFMFNDYNDPYAPYNSRDLISGINFHTYSSDNLVNFDCRYFPDGSTFTTQFGSNVAYADRNDYSKSPLYYVGTTG